MSVIPSTTRGKLDRSGIMRGVQLAIFLVLFGALLFGCAGRLDWWEAWAFLGIYLASVCTNAAWTLKHNPELINERGRIAKDTKSWDKIIVSIYTVFLVVTFPVAGLDARFSWSKVPLWLELVGGLGLVLSLALVFWVMTANSFLASTVHIQEERGHYTITTGPYRYVRHPMYAGMFCYFWAIPLLLGSWWALVPMALNMVLFIIRTALEDKTLQAELPGYREYTQRVRYRLIPGIW